MRKPLKIKEFVFGAVEEGSDFCLAATLLEIIAQDDLFDAVLDE